MFEQARAVHLGSGRLGVTMAVAHDRSEWRRMMRLKGS